MADYFNANISVGGVLTPEAEAALAEAAAEDSARTDYGDDPLTPETAAAAVSAAVAAGAPLTLCDNDALYGRFDAVEDACHEYGLVFVRASEACDEYDAEVAWFDGENDGEALADQSGDPVVRASDVGEALDAHDDPAEQVALVRKLLEAAVPPAVPPLTRAPAPGG